MQFTCLHFMAELYQKYNRLIYCEIVKIVPEPWNAEDVMQSLLVKLINRIELLKTLDQRHLVNYLITAARNSSLNFKRDEKIYNVDFMDDKLASDEDIESVVIRKEDLYSLASVWESLDKRTQYILRARYILNKSGKEIASDLNMPQNNVRMAIVRAKQKARKAMALRKTEKD